MNFRVGKNTDKIIFMPSNHLARIIRHRTNNYCYFYQIRSEFGSTLITGGYRVSGFMTTFKSASRGKQIRNPSTTPPSRSQTSKALFPKSFKMKRSSFPVV